VSKKIDPKITGCVREWVLKRLLSAFVAKGTKQRAGAGGPSCAWNLPFQCTHTATSMKDPEQICEIKLYRTLLTSARQPNVAFQLFCRLRVRISDRLYWLIFSVMFPLFLQDRFWD